MGDWRFLFCKVHCAFLYGPLDSGLLHRGIRTRPVWLGARQLISVNCCYTLYVCWKHLIQILLTNEVANVAYTRSLGHLRAGLEPAVTMDINSVGVWYELIAVCSLLVPVNVGHYDNSPLRGSNPRP